MYSHCNKWGEINRCAVWTISCTCSHTQMRTNETTMYAKKCPVPMCETSMPRSAGNYFPSFLSVQSFSIQSAEIIIAHVRDGAAWKFRKKRWLCAWRGLQSWTGGKAHGVGFADSVWFCRNISDRYESQDSAQNYSCLVGESLPCLWSRKEARGAEKFSLFFLFVFRETRRWVSDPPPPPPPPSARAQV